MIVLQCNGHRQQTSFLFSSNTTPAPHTHTVALTRGEALREPYHHRVSDSRSLAFANISSEGTGLVHRGLITVHAPSDEVSFSRGVEGKTSRLIAALCDAALPCFARDHIYRSRKTKLNGAEKRISDVWISSVGCVDTVVPTPSTFFSYISVFLSLSLTFSSTNSITFAF